MGHITTIPGATTFLFEPPQKNFHFQARGHFLGLTPVFVQKIRFLPYDPNFGQRPSEWLFISHLGNDIPTFRSGVTAVFVKKSSWPVKKSFPSPLWGHRRPVTALALSARRQARFLLFEIAWQVNTKPETLSSLTLYFRQRLPIYFNCSPQTHLRIF